MDEGVQKEEAESIDTIRSPTNEDTAPPGQSKNQGATPPESASHTHTSGTQEYGLLTPSGTLRGSKTTSRPQLQAKASTAVSVTDIYNQALPENSPQIHASRSRAASATRGASHSSRFASRSGSDAEDSASIRSVQSFLPDHGDVESLIGDTQLGGLHFGAPQASRSGSLFPTVENEDFEFQELFEHEFDELEELAADGSNEGKQSP